MSLTTAAPAFLHCNAWTHCFVGSKPSVVRWLTDAECTTILYAEVLDGAKWAALDRAESLDVLESLKDNGLPEAAEDFCVSGPGDAIPEWVPADVAALCREQALAKSKA